MELFKLFGSIAVDNADANKAIDETGEKAESFSSKLGKGIKTAAKWGTAIVAGASTAVVGLAKFAQSSASTADTIDKMSQKIGISRDAYQELDFICSQSGTSVDSLQMGMKSLVAAMDGAVSGTESNIEQFEKLGVSVTDANGNLRSQEEVMWEVMNALQAMDNQTEKARLATELFGRSGSELMPLLNGAAGSIDAMREQAHELGLVLGDELIDNGVELTDTLDQTKRAFKSIVTQLGGSLMPILTKVLTYVQKSLPAIDSLIKKLAPVLSNLFDSLLPPLMELAEEVFPILFDLVEMLIPPVTEIVRSLLPLITSLLSSVIKPLTKLIETVLPPLVKIIQAIIPLLVEIIQAILPVLTRLIETLTPIIEEIIKSILPVIITLINAMLPIFKQFIDIILPILIDLINDLIPVIKQIISSVLPVVIDLIKKLTPLIAKIIDAILPAVIQLIKILTPSFEYIINNILPIIINLIEMLIPIITKIIERILPVVIELVSTIIPILMKIIEAILPVIIQLLDLILPILVQLLDAILPVIIALLEIISPLLEALMPILQPILDLLVLLLEPLIQLLDLILPPLIAVIKVVAQILTDVLAGAFSFVTDIINAVITGPLGGLLDILKTIITFISSVFKGDWETAWKALGNIPVAIINAVISGFESLLNFFINGVNKITSGLSSVWTWIGIPAIPAIPTVNFGRVPKLAEGGVLEKGQVGFLEGDGDEAVVPLEKNTGWIQKVADKIYEFNLKSTENTVDVKGCSEMLADRITGSIDRQTDVLSKVLQTILQAIYKLDEGLGDKLNEAISGMEFRIDEREFARLVKEV